LEGEREKGRRVGWRDVRRARRTGGREVELKISYANRETYNSAYLFTN